MRNLPTIIVKILFLIHCSNELTAQDSQSTGWTTGIYLLGTAGIPKTSFTDRYKYKNSSAIGYGFGMHVSKKGFGLKTEFENVFYNGDYLIYDYNHKLVSTKSLYTKNYFFKILAEFKFNKSGPDIFMNIGPSMYFQEVGEQFNSVLQRGIGPEFNVGISPQLGRFNFIISAGIINTFILSNIELNDLLLYKFNLGLKFNFF